MEVQFHVFLILGVKEDVQLESWLDYFTPVKDARQGWSRKLVGPQSKSGASLPSTRS